MDSVFSDAFWAPPSPGVGDWRRAIEASGGLAPRLSDLLVGGVFYATIVTLLRFALDDLVFIPLGAKLLPPAYAFAAVERPFAGGAPKRALKTLEAAFGALAKPKRADIELVAAQTSMSYDDVARWFQNKRRWKKADKALQKWRESCFRFVAYTTLALFGLYTLIDKPWLRNTEECWSSWPLAPVDPDIKQYYLWSLSLYVHFAFAIFFEVKKKDFFELLGHHVCTIVLIAFSYHVNFVRIGSLVILVHDLADPFLELGKLLNYAKRQAACDAVFTIFAVDFGITRIFMYPRSVIYSALFESRKFLPEFSGYYVFNGLLILLYFLHLYWFYLILRLMYSFAILGLSARDERSQTEESETTPIEGATEPSGGADDEPDSAPVTRRRRAVPHAD